MITKIKIIKSKKELRQLISFCEQTCNASIDFETTGLAYYNEEVLPVGIGTSFQPGSSWYLPLHHKESPFSRGKWEKLFKMYCKGIIENPNIDKIAWNLKFEYKWFMRYGCIPRGRLHDAMLEKYCLDEERPHGLKEFTEVYFPKYAGYDKEVKITNLYNEPLVKVAKYCGIDTDITIRSHIYLEPKLIKNGFYYLYRNLLMMVCRVLAESEFGGAEVDLPYLKDLVKTYAIKLGAADKLLRQNKKLLKFEMLHRIDHNKKMIDKIKLEIKEITKGDSKQKLRMIAGREEKIKQITEGKFTGKTAYTQFNFKSPKQLVELFFDSPHGFNFKPIKKTDSGGWSTDEEVLIKLQSKDKSGFIDELLKFRELEKLDSTYIRGMLAHVGLDKRLHANFHISGTVTGRLSCTEPNLQNIPRDTTAKDIKLMFVPPPGFVLLEVDYSQAELRMVAELAEDEALIEIFRKNYNVHVATACKMFATLEDYDKIKSILKDPKHPEWLTWEKRKKKAKSLNFSILYLQGDEATAETLECSIEEAKKFKKDWFKQFPGVRKWIKNQKALAHEHGYVVNLFGRKRRLHEIDSMKQYLVAEAERQSVNAPIQGASGDFGLFSEVIIREKILSGEFPLDMQQVYRVHDSIGIYIRPTDVHKVVKKIISICDNPETEKYFGFKLKHVTMKVSPEVGRNWAELAEYDSWTDYTKLVA